MSQYTKLKSKNAVGKNILENLSTSFAWSLLLMARLRLATPCLDCAFFGFPSWLVNKNCELRIGFFLIACTRLYKSLCRSVGPSVRHTVSFFFLHFWVEWLIFKYHFNSKTYLSSFHPLILFILKHIVHFQSFFVFSFHDDTLSVLVIFDDFYSFFLFFWCLQSVSLTYVVFNHF